MITIFLAPQIQIDLLFFFDMTFYFIFDKYTMLF